MRRSIDPATRRQLRAILAQIYPDESSMRRVAADADIDLSRVPLNNHATNNWHRVLDEAEFVYRLDALLDVVAEEYATNADLQRICDTYRQATEQATHEDLVSDIERVGDQPSDRQAHEQTTEDHQLDQSRTEVTVQEAFQIERAVRNHPDFATLLRQSDFVSKEERNGRELIVARPKVAVTCTLPIAISGGSCDIEFSDPFLRGLTISLDHKDVLKHLITGRNTPFHWNTRRFIFAHKDGSIQLSMDPVEVLLTEADATDLCACVDTVINAYVFTMMKAETELESWGLPVTKIVSDDHYGYKIFYTTIAIWRQMCKFAQSQSALPLLGYECVTPSSSIQIKAKIGFHAEITPKTTSNSDMLPSDSISLIYSTPYYDDMWGDAIGINGIWTASYTKNWITQDLLPQIENYKVDTPSNIMACPETFWKVDKINLLGSYVRTIQDWLNVYGRNVPTNLFIDYCETFNQLVKQVRVKEEESFWDYVLSNLPVTKESFLAEYDQRPTFSRGALLVTLDANLNYLRQRNYTDGGSADFMIRGYLALLEELEFTTTQASINNFKKVLWPLFERASFENRFRYID